MNPAIGHRTDPVTYWAAARARLDGLPGGRGLNLAHEAVDRHVLHGRGNRTALRLLARGGQRREVSYAELREASNRFAGALDALGVAAGDAVFVLLPRRLDLYVAVLGALKHGAVVCPLFSAYGPEPIAQRLTLGHGRVLVTTAALYERKVAANRPALAELRHVLLADDDATVEGTESLPSLLAAAAANYEIPATEPGQPALLHFTSGTTGAPKGAVHVHEAVVAHHATGTDVLDLHGDDVLRRGPPALRPPRSPGRCRYPVGYHRRAAGPARGGRPTWSCRPRPSRICSSVSGAPRARYEAS
ncbi:MAG: AMP-binding protein, partial [Acidimicrobiales bacterium]